MVMAQGSCLVPSLFAGVWSCAVGDARAVRRKTADVAERLNEKFPYSIACQPSALLDNAACQLVDSVSRGAPWHHVQSSLQRTCALAGHVNALVNADCDVRNDRRMRDRLIDWFWSSFMDAAVEQQLSHALHSVDFEIRYCRRAEQWVILVRRGLHLANEKGCHTASPRG